MKKLLFLSLILSASISYAQPDTEVYLLDLNKKNGTTVVSNLRNISNNDGYDNQPSFYDEEHLVFASTRNGQTDIAKYEISTGKTTWLTDTQVGSEYSPLRIPNSKDLSAVRLDTTGYQRLYRYDIATGSSEELLKDQKVGYHVWYSEDLLVTTVLVENRMDLVVSNLKDHSNYTVQKNVGRSLLPIPNSELVSYISKEGRQNKLRSLHPVTGATADIINISSDTNDINWLSDGSVLLPFENKIQFFKREAAPKIKTLHKFQEEGIHKISRMALSPNGKQLAIVAEASPASIVQKQVDSYNAGDLDAFVSCYSEDVIVRSFPDKVWYVGHEKMRNNYSGLSPENKEYNVSVVKRIVIGNKVIDHEKVMRDGKFEQMQVAIYEVNNGKISSMSFIFDKDDTPDPEPIVQNQLDKYNNRDIEGFLETYTEDVTLFNFPAEQRSKGRAEMRKGYSEFFESTLDLHCEIKNRIVIGNFVIDEEYITANNSNFSAVAVYEVKNGKISKVTFLR